MGLMSWSITNWAATGTLQLGDNGTAPELLKDARLYPRSEAAMQYTGIITADLGTSRSPNVFAVLNHNFIVDDDVAILNVVATIQAADDTGFSAGLVTAMPSLALPPMGHASLNTALRVTAALNKRYWRMTFTWTGGPRTLRLGELFIGPLTVIPRGLGLDAQRRLSCAMNRARTLNGDEWAARLGGPIIERDLVVAQPSESELASLLAMQRAGLGGSRPILWLPQHTASGEFDGTKTGCLYGRLSEELSSVELEPGRYSISPLSLRSMPESGP